jgi:hypothetical protein
LGLGTLDLGTPCEPALGEETMEHQFFVTIFELNKCGGMPPTLCGNFLLSMVILACTYLSLFFNVYLTRTRISLLEVSWIIMAME